MIVSAAPWYAWAMGSAAAVLLGVFALQVCAWFEAARALREREAVGDIAVSGAALPKQGEPERASCSLSAPFDWADGDAA